MVLLLQIGTLYSFESAQAEVNQDLTDKSKKSESWSRSEIISQSEVSPHIRGILNGEVLLYLDPIPDYAASGLYDALENRINTISEKNPANLKFKIVTNPNDADITFSWQKDPITLEQCRLNCDEVVTNPLGLTVTEEEIIIILGSENCIGNWEALDIFTVTQVFVHELGHGLGYEHSDDPSNVMYSEGHGEYVIEHDFTQTLPGQTFVNVNLCDTGSYSYSVSASKTDVEPAFNLHVIPFTQDPLTDFYNNDGSFLESCSSLNKKGTGTLSCSFDEFHSLLITNISENPITVKIQAWKNYEKNFGNLWDDNYLIYPPEMIESTWTLASLSKNNNLSIEQELKQLAIDYDNKVDTALDHFNKKEYQKAIVLWKESLVGSNHLAKFNTKISSESILYNIAMSYVNLKDYDNAIKYLDELIEINPNFEDAKQKREKYIDIDSSGGGCLIATAAYGTELAPQVQFLREVRDNTVMSTESGTAFMTGFNTLYYSFAPSIADMERQNQILQEAVRAFITPMISTLSIMSLADDGSEVDVLGLGISIIALNLGMYVAAPAIVMWQVRKRI